MLSLRQIPFLKVAVPIRYGLQSSFGATEAEQGQCLFASVPGITRATHLAGLLPIMRPSGDFAEQCITVRKPSQANNS